MLPVIFPVIEEYIQSIHPHMSSLHAQTGEAMITGEVSLSNIAEMIMIGEFGDDEYVQLKSVERDNNNHTMFSN